VEHESKEGELMATQTNPPRPPAPGAGDSGASDAQAKAQEKAQEAASQAQEKAQAAAGQAQAKLREQLDQRSAQVAAQVNEQASDLRSVSQTLREQGKDGPAKAADRLAEYAEKVGGYLRDKDADALLRDAENFGRRQPAAVAAGGLALGFLVSRFLKASSSRRYSSQSAGQLPRPHPAAPPRSAGAGSGASSPRPPVPGTPPPPSGVPPVRSGV
jgi:hypothetical protein